MHEFPARAKDGDHKLWKEMVSESLWKEVSFEEGREQWSSVKDECSRPSGAWTGQLGEFGMDPKAGPSARPK